VCNLTVADLHTFAVGKAAVLVHNVSGTGGTSGLSGGAYPNSPQGKGSVPPSQRDPKQVWTRAEKQTHLDNAQDGKCARCGVRTEIDHARGHHRTRHADGGKTDNANLDILCEGCHNEVHCK
jgi:hypothetical protein